MHTPLTPPGRWSLLASAAFAICLAVFILMVSVGQRGGEEFFDNLWLTVPFLAAYVAAVAAFVLGVAAIVACGERKLSVVGSTIVGLLVTTFGVLEVAFPH